MKKFVSFMLTGVAMTACCFTLSSCGTGTENENLKIMDISCNPAIEFVLNDRDIVVGVNATNEEGNLILQANVSNGKSNFEGKTASEAGLQFVKTSNELGFIVSGDADAKGGTVSISFSGDTSEATKLFNSIKDKIDTYLTAENLTLVVNKAKEIARTELEKLVATVSPYIDEAEIKAMEYGKLIKEVYNSHKETAQMYSQELKNAYYQAKAEIMENATFEVLKGQLNTVTQAIVETTMRAYNGAISTLEQTRNALLVDETSLYQQSLNAFRKAKADFLNYRQQIEAGEISTEMQAELERLEGLVVKAETTLQNACESANESIDNAKKLAKELKDQIISTFNTASVNASNFVNEISQKQATEMENFKTQFETNYATAISNAKANWQEMLSLLQPKQA